MKHPLDLYKEWADCHKCDLGHRRAAMQKNMVIGEGTTNAIMIIGEGPGRNEEEEGRPFVGKSGELLRQILDAYKLTDFCYITNIVACRSCEPVLDDATGLPKLRKRKNYPDEPMFSDQVPTPLQMNECADRLYEEIYLVDPVVILALGSVSASFLLKKPVSVTKDRGIPRACKIPGRLWLPQLTDKKKVWTRKVKGVEVSPVERNEVEYIVVPSLHPAYVLRKESDHGHDSPWNQLASDIKLVGDIFEKHTEEVYGTNPMGREVL